MPRKVRNLNCRPGFHSRLDLITCESRNILCASTLERIEEAMKWRILLSVCLAPSLIGPVEVLVLR